MKKSTEIKKGKKQLRSYWSKESQLILDSHIAELELLESIEYSLRTLRRKSYHEHNWQLHPSGWSEGSALFICECGEQKRVKMMEEITIGVSKD